MSLSDENCVGRLMNYSYRVRGEVSALAEERPELIRALNSVLADERISGVCKGRNDLSEHITEELIRFVSEGCTVSEKGDPSLDEELERLQEFKAKGAHKFEAELKSLSTMLSDRYTTKRLIRISIPLSLKQSMKFERKRIG